MIQLAWADVFCNLNEPIKEGSQKEGGCLAAFLRKAGAKGKIARLN